MTALPVTPWTTQGTTALHVQLRTRLLLGRAGSPSCGGAGLRDATFMLVSTRPGGVQAGCKEGVRVQATSEARGDPTPKSAAIKGAHRTRLINLHPACDGIPPDGIPPSLHAGNIPPITPIHHHHLTHPIQPAHAPT